VPTTQVPTNASLSSTSKGPKNSPMRNTTSPTPEPTDEPTDKPESTNEPGLPSTTAEGEGEWETCVHDFRLFTDNDESDADTGLLSVDFDAANEKVRLNLTGPSDKWFAIGFGSHVMSDTYAVAVSGESFMDISQRRLANHAVGSPIDGGTSTEQSSDDGTRRNVSIVMDWSHGYGFSDFFLCRLTALPIIWAHGVDTTFAYHGVYKTDALQLASCSVCDIVNAETAEDTTDTGIIVVVVVVCSLVVLCVFVAIGLWRKRSAKQSRANSR